MPRRKPKHGFSLTEPRISARAFSNKVGLGGKHRKKAAKHRSTGKHRAK